MRDEVPDPDADGHGPEAMGRRVRQAQALADQAAGLVRRLAESPGQGPDLVDGRLAELEEVARKLDALAGSFGDGEAKAMPAPYLTKMEEEVAAWAATGLTNAEIGDKLFVSANTVKTHMGRVLTKLGLSSRRQLARRAPRTPG